MKKTLALTIALILSILLASPAAAAGELTIMQENFVVLPYEDYYAGVVYVELKNTGDKPVEFGMGRFQLAKADGELIRYLDLDSFDCNPEVLQPDETSYMRIEIKVEEAKEADYIADYALTILGHDYIATEVTRFSTTAEYHKDEDRISAKDYVVATIKNDTAENLFDFYVVYVLKDADGALLFTNLGNYISPALMANSFSQMRFRIDQNAVDYMEKNNLVPVIAEAIAFKSAPK